METRKIVVNDSYGGFGMSEKATNEFMELSGQTGDFWINDISRDDPILVDIVERYGKDVNDSYSNLKIVEIPVDVNWQIDEYDGLEWVAEQHRTWYPKT